MSTCRDTDNLNMLVKCEQDTDKTLTLEYCPYKNWGRWNHNPSRVDVIIEVLHELGFNVQLKHIPEEDENTHGNICIKNAENKEIVSCSKFQHNTNFRNRQDLLKEMMKDFNN